MKHASATRSAGANSVIACYQPAGVARGIVCIAAILSLAILFVYAKFGNTSTVPRVLASGLACPRRVKVVNVDAARPSGVRVGRRRVVAGAVGGSRGRRHGGVLVLAQRDVSVALL